MPPTTFFVLLQRKQVLIEFGEPEKDRLSVMADVVVVVVVVIDDVDDLRRLN